MNSEVITQIVIVLTIWGVFIIMNIAAFLVLRLVVLWYWKVNDVVSALQGIQKSNEQIVVLNRKMVFLADSKE
jgi:hypothetical protein